MGNYITFQSNGVFFLTALINAAVCYALFGPVGGTMGVVTVMLANIVYGAKDDSSNELYLLFLLSLVLVGGGIGYVLKLSGWFYVFLFAISYFHYISFGKDPYIDRTFTFFVIFSCMGTTLPGLDAQLPMAFMTGIFISLTILTFLGHKAYRNGAFKNGIFSRGLYESNENLGSRAAIYSTFLFMSLAIPHYLDLYRVYWAPLTFAVLLRPKETDVIPTTIYRFVGSVCGAALVFGLIYIKISERIYIDFIVLVLLVFFLPTFLRLHYAVKTFGITAFVLLLLEQTEFLHDPTYLLPYSRVYETFIGGGMAIAASIVLRSLRLSK